MYYKDRIIWITGASSGIGAALARELSRQGSTLILSARNTKKLEEVRQTLTDPARHEVLPLDLTNTDSLEDIVAEAVGYYGRVDFLFNNGGVSQRALAIDTPIDVDRKLMETNYLGPVALTKALLPSMLSLKKGHIVVISSLTGKFGTPLRSGYAASKHALHGFFDALRAEMWREGIAVTLICPGYVKTDISLNAMTADGSPQGTMDKGQENGMLPEQLAKKILRAVEAGKNEVYIGGYEKIGVYIKRFLPDIFSRMIRGASTTG
ncbi:MAG: SDR family oxidoreductase [Rhodothermales bacterium]